MSPYLPPLAVTHAFHTEAEHTMDGVTITAEQATISFLRAGWTGPVYMVFHSAMPADLEIHGNRARFFELVGEMRHLIQGQFPIRTALECNIHRSLQPGGQGFKYFVDGDPSGFDHLIAACHCTALCGWYEDRQNTPEEFYQAYSGVLNKLVERQLQGYTVTLGHLLQYASGSEWENYWLTSVTLSTLYPPMGFEFNIPGLRERANWDEDLLKAGLEGPAFSQPWAAELQTMPGTMIARIATDFHKLPQLRCMTYPNWKLFCDFMEERNLLRHLVAVQ